jgi:16S rRNA processing protein RimM
MIDVFIYPTATHLLIGKITGAHGLGGDVRIVSFSGQPENIKGYKQLITVSSSGQCSPPYKVERSRTKGRSAIVHLASIDTRDQAEALTGLGVLLPKEDLPQPEKDEFYLYHMEGLPVTTVDGRRLGTVAHIFSNGAQDLLVVRDAKEEYLIPVLDSVIVFHDAEKIVIAPPPGLLEINSSDSGQ